MRKREAPRGGAAKGGCKAARVRHGSGGGVEEGGGGGGGSGGGGGGGGEEEEEEEEEGGGGGGSDTDSEGEDSEEEEEFPHQEGAVPAPAPPASAVDLSAFVDAHSRFVPLPPLPSKVLAELVLHLPKFGFQKKKKRGTLQPPDLDKLRLAPGPLGQWLRDFFTWAATYGARTGLGNFLNFSCGVDAGAAGGVLGTGWHGDNFLEPKKEEKTVARLLCWYGAEKSSIAVRKAGGSGVVVTVDVPAGCAFFGDAALLSSTSPNPHQHTHATVGRNINLVVEVRGHSREPPSMPPILTAAQLAQAAAGQPPLVLPVWDAKVFKGPNRMFGQEGGGSEWRNAMRFLRGPRGARVMTRANARRHLVEIGEDAVSKLAAKRSAEMGALPPPPPVLHAVTARGTRDALFCAAASPPAPQAPTQLSRRPPPLLRPLPLPAPPAPLPRRQGVPLQRRGVPPGLRGPHRLHLRGPPPQAGNLPRRGPRRCVLGVEGRLAQHLYAFPRCLL